ncbi:MAG: L-histidine N(alpha)-methyltransferase [Pseudomonadota bacterium]|nr:MAG: L-histidine N(alpha)-methyltransferase [Pseudomonadota bacterium]
MTPSKQHEAFRADVIEGLSATPRTIPCKYLYDARGSELFEVICRTDDYYVTRADLALHERHLPAMAQLIGPCAHIIEFGSGAGLKTRKLLASLETVRAYTPIEISAAALAASSRELEAGFPDIPIHPVQADYTRPIPEDAVRLDPPPRKRVVYYPGSTISNFEHDEAVAFLTRMARIAGERGAILIGVDLIKSPQRLRAAYDDRQGVTAAFNLNLLHRLRRDLDADLDVDAFAHEARFNEPLERIEMHLVARRATCIAIDEREFRFAPGDSIHTESSHKYSVESFQRLAARAGLESGQVWKDPEGLFSMHWLIPAAAAARRHARS